MQADAYDFDFDAPTLYCDLRIVSSRWDDDHHDWFSVPHEALLTLPVPLKRPSE